MSDRGQVKHILSATDIVSLISRYVSLKNTGKNFIGLCPFHNESTPSFSVSPSYNRYRCFGCGAQGDPLEFLIQIENITFPAALEKLAQDAGIKLEKSSRSFQSANNSLNSCLDFALEHFNKNLSNAPEGSPIREYISGRGLDDATINKYSLGYAINDWNALNNFLGAKKIPQDILISAGLVKKSEHGKVYDFLRNRLIFPVRNDRGQLTGFSGRSIDNSIPKYINPPESELYKKSNILYGLFEASDAIRKNKRVVITEGYMDCLALAKNGIHESIAICGTALTNGHVSLLSRFKSAKVILMLDSDEAGIRATVKSIALLLAGKLPTYVCQIPGSKDPDDFAKESPGGFSELLENAVDGADYFVSYFVKALNNADLPTRESLIREYGQLTAKFDPSVNDFLLGKLGQQAAIFKTTSSPSEKTENQDQTINQSHPSALESIKNIEKNFPLEFQLLDFIINRRIKVEKILPLINPGAFNEHSIRDLLQRMQALSEEDLSIIEGSELSDLFNEHRDIIDYIILFKSKASGDGAVNQVSLKKFFKSYKQLYFEYSKPLLNQTDAPEESWLEYKTHLDKISKMI